METVKLDYHIHSALSHDSDESIATILDHAAERLDAIAITDHDHIENSLAARDRAPDGLTVIPGVEVSTEQGHLICLGIEAAPEAGMDCATVAEHVHERDGLVIVPHPFQRFRHGMAKEHIERIEYDCLETFNSRTLIGYRNRKARGYAKAQEAPMVGGSDAHAAAYIGQAWTEVEADGTDAAAILDAMRAGRTTPKGSRTPVLTYISQVVF